MRILFIGNSYTERNNLPGMLEQLAADSGRAVSTAAVTPGGQTLQGHWYDPAVQKAIGEDSWDYVVLQEQSTRPVEEPDAFLSAAMRIAERLKPTDAKIVLYLTWARQHIPEMQAELDTSYLRVAEVVGAGIAPVGTAWRTALGESPGLSLYEDDRSHPTVLGTYLAACVFFCVLFQQSPVGLSNRISVLDGVSLLIDENVAQRLQRSAQMAVDERGNPWE